MIHICKNNNLLYYVFHLHYIYMGIAGTDSYTGQKIVISELEWMLAQTGAFKTDLEENPRKAVQDVLINSLRGTGNDDDDDDDDY